MPKTRIHHSLPPQPTPPPRAVACTTCAHGAAGRAGPGGRIGLWRAALALLIAAWLGPCLAQTPPACGDSPAVRSAVVLETGRKPPPGGGAQPAYLNDRVAIGVCRLDALLAAAAARQKSVSLTINGIDAGLAPTTIDREQQQLVFVLNRTSDNQALWKSLLLNPFTSRHDTLRLSVGVAGEAPLPWLAGAANTLTFNKLWIDGWTFASCGALLVVLVLTVYLGRQSDMLRDAPTVDGVRQTYSLARVQMAWWFVLVVCGFVIILLVTGDADSLPASIIALTGISAATGVAAVLITPRAEQRLAARKADLAARRAALDDAAVDLRARLAALQQQTAAATAAGESTASLDARGSRLRDRLAAGEQQAGQLEDALDELSPVVASQGLLEDLVSDDSGHVALDRLQMVVWTVVLGGLYLHSVLAYVAMPDFSATLLGLMGVSSGTYIGFKIPARG